MLKIAEEQQAIDASASYVYMQQSVQNHPKSATYIPTAEERRMM